LHFLALDASSSFFLATACRMDILGVSKDGPLTWSYFEPFLMTSFGKIEPMTQYFKDYEACEQTTTVTDYVSRLRTCLNNLKGTYLELSPGIACVKFLKGLRPDIAKLVQAAALMGGGFPLMLHIARL